MSEVVVSTRVRLARNLREFPFPGRLSDQAAQQVAQRVTAALNTADVTFHTVRLSEMTAIERSALVERHLISPEFTEPRPGRVLLLSDDNTVSVMLNEEDHIRLQVILPSLELDRAYEIANALDDVLSRELELAFDERLGYLTRCPTNLGTAMRASVMLHLPALEQSGAVARIGANLGKLGLTMRGLYGESSKPAGSFYQLSNQVTLGISERAAVENLHNITTQLITQEIKARDTVLSDITVVDRIHRGLGVLRTARLMDHSEAMRLLSLLRLGVSSKLFDTLSTDSIDRLIVEVQPANILTRFGDTCDERERDIRRAALIRERLQ